MKIGYIILLLAGFGIWQGYKNSNPKKIQMASVSAPNACIGKKLCAIVYLAPWCPACEQMSPTLKAFLVNSKSVPDYGFQIIIGDERRPGDNTRKAEAMGPGTIIDDDRSLARAMNVTYYPTFYVVDGSGGIVKKDQEAMNWANQYFAGR